MHGETKGQVRNSEHRCASAPTEDRGERDDFLLILVGFFPLWGEGFLRETRDVWPS